MTFTRLDMPVFPAHAGMFPKLKGGSFGAKSFPRARGDVPSFASRDAAEL